MCTLVEFHAKQKAFGGMAEYMEAIVLPSHPFLRHATQDKTAYAWHSERWIDLNDYSIIPLCVRPEPRQHFADLVRPPVSTLCNLNSDTDDAKQHAESNWRQQPQLLMIMTCSNWAEKEEKEANGQEDQQGMDTALDTLWCNMEALPIVVAEPSKDMEATLSMCSGDNSAWVLVWCMHSLNRMLFASNVSDKRWMAVLAVVCSAYCKCAELLRVMVGEAEQAHCDTLGIDGVQLKSVWRFV